MLIKFCGMTREEDLEQAAALGAECCGFIFHPKSPRYIAPKQVAALPSFGMKRVGVFVDESAEEIAQIMRLANLDFAQLHGTQSITCAARLGAERIIRVLWPERYSSLPDFHEDADRHAQTCSFYLLDSGKGGGGSGIGLNWDNLGKLILPHPFFLAGGLNADNVSRALSICQPDGLDFNSGIELEPGIKSASKMRSVLASIHKTGGSFREK